MKKTSLKLTTTLILKKTSEVNRLEKLLLTCPIACQIQFRLNKVIVKGEGFQFYLTPCDGVRLYGREPKESFKGLLIEKNYSENEFYSLIESLRDFTFINENIIFSYQPNQGLVLPGVV